MLDKNNKILIVGLGLLGGSYAEALTCKGYQVYAIDTSFDTIVYAKEKKIIIDGKTIVEQDFVEQFDIIIFCLYPKVFIDWIEKYQSYIKPNALLTDVTGIKKYVIDKLNKILRPDLNFVGHHPMAGKEVYGVQNATKEMFIGANCIITPTEDSKVEFVNKVIDLVKLLDFKNITVLSPEVHDEMIGFLSQLTHCIAVSLMTCKDSVHLAKYTGDSFRDLTRIAKINENMWSELFLLNKAELLEQMDLFEKQFTMLKNSIENEDLDTMKEIMRLSTKRRSYFDK